MADHDVQALREVAKQYLEIAQGPTQEAKREIWRQFHAFEDGPVPLVAPFAGYYWWVKHILDPQLVCEDPLYRGWEFELRRRIGHAALRDDTVFEPWLTVPAAKDLGGPHKWGIPIKQSSDPETNARHQEYTLTSWDLLPQVQPAPHKIDEAKTTATVAKLQDAVGDLLEIDVDRAPWCKTSFGADLSTDLGYLRGIERFMMDMYEYPAELHQLMATMRDGVLAAQDAAEAAGDISLSGYAPQHPMPYDREVEPPKPNSGPRQRSEVWYFCAAQEFIGVSPAMHEEFLLQYQLPIISRYKKVHYGCCEDLTQKIDMLRKVPNLACISVTPSADVRRCGEQIGRDYLISWRPDPARTVCFGYDEERIAKDTRAAQEAFRGGRFCVHLKDVETVEDEPARMGRWVALMRRLLD